MIRVGWLAGGVAVIGSAAQACPMSLAIYTEPQSGFELRFRVAQPWEQIGMVDHAIELALPDGRVLWGQIAQNMGVSRQEGTLYAGCPRHSTDGPTPQEVLDECQAWQGVVYGLKDGRIGPVPQADEKAPPSLVLADFGRQLRYSVMDGPEVEIWDQLDLTACAE
jgi:hypothetical protein